MAFCSARTPNPDAGGGNLFKYGSNYYTIVTDPTNLEQIRAYKGSDITGTGTEQDSANRPSLQFSDTQLPTLASGFQVLQDPNNSNKLHVLCGMYAPTIRKGIAYARFDMATDTWDTVDGGTGKFYRYYENLSYSTAGIVFMAGIRSDSDLVIAHQGDSIREMGTNYNRIYIGRLESGTWTGPTLVWDSGNTFHQNLFSAGMAANDVFYFGLTESGERWCSINGSNTINNAFYTGASYAGDFPPPFCPGVIQDGSEDIRFLGTVSYNQSPRAITLDVSVPSDSLTIESGAPYMRGSGAAVYDPGSGQWYVISYAFPSTYDLYYWTYSLASGWTGEGTVQANVTAATSQLIVAALVEGSTIHILAQSTVNGALNYYSIALASATIGKVAGVSWASVGKVMGVAKASIAKVAGVDAP